MMTHFTRQCQPAGRSPPPKRFDHARKDNCLDDTLLLSFLRSVLLTKYVADRRPAVRVGEGIAKCENPRWSDEGRGIIGRPAASEQEQGEVRPVAARGE